VAVFLILEVTPAVTGADFGNLSTLAAIGAFYGMMYLAFRLGEANQQAERLLVELRESQAAQARAAGMAERQRLAREMHDVLAHSLSGLMLQLEGARMMAAEDPADPRLPGTIDRAHRLGKSGLEEARRAIGMLRDDVEHRDRGPPGHQRGHREDARQPPADQDRRPRPGPGRRLRVPARPAALRRQAG
jgi:signal transduction histidine kinase